jgi:tight adherence protein B
MTTLLLVLSALLTFAAVCLISSQLLKWAVRLKNRVASKARFLETDNANNVVNEVLNESDQISFHSQEPDSSNKKTPRFQGALATELLRNGISVLKPISKRLLQLAKVRFYAECLQSALSFKDLKANQTAIIDLSLGLSLLLGAVISLLTKQLLFGIVVALAIPLVAQSRAEKAIQRRRELVRIQLPEALQSLGFSLGAGYSLSQALQQAVSECPQPLALEMAIASADVRSGKTVQEALMELEQRISLEEFSFLTTALEIQHRSGGSMKDLLDSAAKAIRSSVDLQRQLEVQTTQARLSFRIVAFMPLVLVAILSLVVDGYLASFFSSLGGFMLLVVAAAMEGLGIFLIKRILKVDLG